jgi:hypothetical protein
MVLKGAVCDPAAVSEPVVETCQVAASALEEDAARNAKSVAAVSLIATGNNAWHERSSL